MLSMLAAAFPMLPIPAGASRLILVRHGAVWLEARPGWPDIPRVRADAFYGGNIDVPLSQRGEAEAQAAAAAISERHAAEICQIWSSPMSRALYGARRVSECVAAKCGAASLEVQPFEAFRELDRGLWTNMTQAEVEADPRWGAGAFERCAREPGYGRDYCQGEGMSELRARVLGQRDALLDSVAALGL